MAKRFDKDNYVKNLPDAFAKSPTSNNYKILKIEHTAQVDMLKTLKEIDDILDLSNATGKTLDRYGTRVGQTRGLATDAQYRAMIKARMLRNLTNGSYKSVVESICATFSCTPKDVTIKESDENPCVVEFVGLPLESLNKSGFTVSQSLALLKTLLPVAIALQTTAFEGTFEFSDVENEQSNTAGFSNDEGTIGGYLGDLYGNTNEPILPL